MKAVASKTLPGHRDQRRSTAASCRFMKTSEEKAEQWGIHGGGAVHVELELEPVSEHMEWKHLFPEWINQEEEEENEGPSCPKIPMPALPLGEVEAAVPQLPRNGAHGTSSGCRYTWRPQERRRRGGGSGQQGKGEGGTERVQGGATADDGGVPAGRGGGGGCDRWIFLFAFNCNTDLWL